MMYMWGSPSLHCILSCKIMILEELRLFHCFFEIIAMAPLLPGRRGPLAVIAHKKRAR